MNCPSCNQVASTFLRYSFSLRGVSISKGMLGYFKCQHCGTLLRVGKFSKPLWYLFVGTIVVLAVFALLYKRLLLLAGSGVTAAIWIFIILALMSVFTYGLWKFALVEKVDK